MSTTSSLLQNPVETRNVLSALSIKAPRLINKLLSTRRDNGWLRQPGIGTESVGTTMLPPSPPGG